jgi:hypothetical protein
MRTLLGAALAVLFTLASLPAIAAGPNCTSGSITAQNANQFTGTATTASAVAQGFSSGSPSATIFTGANNVTSFATWEISGTWSGELTFQFSQNEASSTWQSLPVIVMGSSAPGQPSPTIKTSMNGNFGAQITGATNVRVTATQNGTFSGTASVYMCSYQGGMTGITPSQVQGAPFGLPLNGNITQWGGQNVPLGPGPSLSVLGYAPRFALSSDSNGRVSLDHTLATYRASASFTPLATAALTLVSIQGSASKQVRITRVLLSGHSTANAQETFALQRTSTLGTGGTVVSPSIGKLDTTFATASAVVKHFTTGAQSVGSAVGGPLSTFDFFTGVVTTPTVYTPWVQIYPELGEPGQSIVLRGTADFLELQNVNAGNLSTGTVLQYTVEWTEVDAQLLQ